jgi:SAM-dependent methyltransferase
MFELEDRLWWYRGLRLYLERAVRAAGLPGAAAVLDAGCGTGANLALLTRLFPRAVGCDLALQAVACCARRGLGRALVADLNALPFRSGTFDLLLCADVLECREVDEARAVAELVRVTRPGGRLVLTAAAYQFLMSEHDEAVHAVRRYTRARARRALAVPGLEIVAMRHCFGLLAGPIVAYRLLRRGLSRRRAAGAAPRSDLFLPPRPLNALLYAVVRLEAALARLAPLPFGTTLLVELRRV